MGVSFWAIPLTLKRPHLPEVKRKALKDLKSRGEVIIARGGCWLKMVFSFFLEKANRTWMAWISNFFDLTIYIIIDLSIFLFNGILPFVTMVESFKVTTRIPEKFQVCRPWMPCASPGAWRRIPRKGQSSWKTNPWPSKSRLAPLMMTFGLLFTSV